MTHPVPQRVLLTIRFDADQISNQLNYKLDRSLQQASTSGIPPTPEEGEYAGSLYFYPGEQVGLQVVGGGKEDFVGFDVIQCSFLTEPQLISCGPTVPTVYSLPSMFEQGKGAVLSINPEFHTTTKPQKDGRHLIIQDWTGELDVTKVHGRWELSCCLTIRIRRANGRAELRVLCFDPESEVGTGVNPPGCQSEQT
ncbi:hypothetical protein ACLB1G_10390 [Oxalobacteraceae bacterium A2-2]